MHSELPRHLSLGPCGILFAMSFRKPWLVMGALLLGGGSLAAQQVGSAPPAFDFVKVWNDGPESFDEFEGKVVILDFSETW